MTFFDSPKINKSLNIILKDIEEELRNFEDYYRIHKKKLQIVQDFTTHLNFKHLNRLKDELLDLKKLEFLDLDEIRKETKYDRKSLKLIEEAIDQESDPEIRLQLAIILDRMKLLNSIFRKLKRIIRAEISWLKRNENSILKEHQKIQQFLRLVKAESFLLYEHNLSGQKNEKEILKDIYDQIMPLKDRIVIKRLDEGAVCSPLLIEPTISGKPYVLKKYGGSRDWILKVIRRGLTLDEAKQRKRMIDQYYNYYRNAGINVPPRGAFAVINYGKNNFQVALKEEFIKNNVEDIIRNPLSSKEAILDIYEKILDIAYKDVRAGSKYLSDYFLRNFCMEGNEVFYIDTDPPLYQFMTEDGKVHFKLVEVSEGLEVLRNLHRQRHKALTGQSEEELGAAYNRGRDSWIYRLSTPQGKFMYIVAFSIIIRPDMEKEFKQTLLNFLQKHELTTIYGYFTKMFNNPGFDVYVNQRRKGFKPRVQAFVP